MEMSKNEGSPKIEWEFGIVPKAVMRDKTLSASAKGLYAYLSVFCDTERRCFPSRELIANELGVTNNTLGKLLKQLTQAGYLEISRIKGERGRYGRNLYRLHEAPCVNLPYIKKQDTVKPDMVKPDMENPYANNTSLNNTSLNNTSIKEKDAPACEGGKAGKEAFTPPNEDEVQAYCRERKSMVSAQAFVDYYTAIGWKVGKNPMRDWKAALRTWEARDRAEGKHNNAIDYSDDVELPF